MSNTAFLKPRIIDVQNLSTHHARLTMERTSENVR